MGAIYLIRHGQASFGRADYDKLSDTGAEQARVLGTALKNRLPKVDAVYAGAMLRHHETATHCLEAMELAAGWAEDVGWNEYDHNDIVHRFNPKYANQAALIADMAKGLNPRKAFQEMFSQAIDRWVQGETDDYNESWRAFCDRVEDALSRTLEDLGPSKTALVFTSGGAISIVCKKLLRISDEDIFRLNWTIANASITKIIYGKRGVHLSTLNEHSHFEGAHSHLITYR